MPISKYFGGSGEEVMSNMTKEYGAKKGKQVFYATANKRKMTSHQKRKLSPSGDLGAARQQEGDSLSKFKNAGKIVSTAKEFSEGGDRGI